LSELSHGDNLKKSSTK